MSERIVDGEYIVVRRGKEKLSDHIDLKEDNWSIGSKKKLKVSMRHKMKLIFKKTLDFLDEEVECGNMDKDVAKRIRKRVLNIGNDQIRSMEAELDERYNVEALNYHVEFKVIGPGGTK